ncbi:MAG TPA: D-glucuronyl C5-epimerase family protein [Thermoleophilia bacterium]
MFTFRAWAFEALDVPVGSRPFDYPKAGTLGTNIPTGVSMKFINGVPYDFALRQTQTGYHALNSYRLTGEQFLLLRAQAQADHLIAVHASVGDGWFYPSGFAYRFGDVCPDLLVPPWYSGLAQGTAVGFFARLYEATGKLAYKDAAEHTLESFLVRRGANHPWVSAVDSSGYLRLEEYPGTGWEFVFNGHMDAAMGLWDYYRVTHDARALALYKGAMTSVVRYGERFRNAGWVSAYSLGARARFITYHVMVMRQLRQLYTISGDARFIHLVDHFDDDFPAPEVSGAVKVLPGDYLVCRFAPSGARLASRTIHPRAEVRYQVDRRRRIFGQRGIWLHITSGSLQGYFVREAVGHVYIPGAVDALIYDPPINVTLRAGQWTAQQFDAQGAVIATQAIDLASAQRAQASQRAIVNGVPRVLLASDSLTDFWLPQRAVILP